MDVEVGMIVSDAYLAAYDATPRIDPLLECQRWPSIAHQGKRLALVVDDVPVSYGVQRPGREAPAGKQEQRKGQR